jgi:PqqD family protein of HPr-rel-A system
MSDGPHYRIEPEAELVIRPLDDVTLIYHRRSGQTHMVVSPVPEIVRAFAAGGAMTAGEVVTSLSHDYDLGDPVEALAGVETHLRHLCVLGLVQRD